MLAKSRLGGGRGCIKMKMVERRGPLGGGCIKIREVRQTCLCSSFGGGRENGRELSPRFQDAPCGLDNFALPMRSNPKAHLCPWRAESPRSSLAQGVAPFGRPGLGTLPPAEVERWLSAILRDASVQMCMTMSILIHLPRRSFNAIALISSFKIVPWCRQWTVHPSGVAPQIPRL